jgi:hypothetical protein
MGIFTVCLLALSAVLAVLAIGTWRLNAPQTDSSPTGYRTIGAREDELRGG